MPPPDGLGETGGEVLGDVDGDGGVDGEGATEGLGEGAPEASAVTPMSSGSGNSLEGSPLSASRMYSVQITVGMSPPWMESTPPTWFMDMSFLSAEVGSVRNRVTAVDSSGV
ncbi:hypothetical protein ACFQFR_18560 [Streptomyces goshikiensis]